MSKLREKKILNLNADQEARLVQLRADRDKDQVLNKPSTTPEPLTGGVPVYVCIEGVSFSGYIMHETNNSYDVKTPHGYLNVPKTAVKARNVQDFSNVTISPELHDMTTKQLLQHLKWNRQSSNWDYDTDELKAVLSTREHVPSKKEAKIAKKYAK